MTATVTLRDGRQVSSWSEEWRHECEARAILLMPTAERRRAHLQLIEARRGKPARQALETEILAQWFDRQARAS